MTSVFLTSCTEFFLIKWVSNILGFIINLFYEVSSKFGIEKIGFVIIVFTIIVRLLMMPISIKQQKSVKLNSVITPEIQAIQKKYANKKDQESMMRQSAELNAVYQKYGTSPTSGCLPLLIQMPIIFGLLGMMYCLPNYINDIRDLYDDGVVSYVIGTDDKGELDYSTIKELKNIDSLSDKLLENKKSKDDKLDVLITAYLGKDGDNKNGEIYKAIYDSFTNVYSRTFGTETAWDAVNDGISTAIKDIDKLKGLSDEEWDKLESEKLLAYKDLTDNDWDAMTASYKGILHDMEANRKEITNVYSFFGIDLSKSPADGVKIAIIIPLLSVLAQLLNMKISMANQQKTGNDTADSMMSSMKVMSYTMCIVSGIFCYTFQAALGLYWVISSLVQALMQVFLNKHFEKMDTETIIKENVEKANKKRAKAGIAPNTISTAASVNAKNYQQVGKNTNTNQNVQSHTAPKKGSLAEKANMVSKYADKK